MTSDVWPARLFRGEYGHDVVGRLERDGKVMFGEWGFDVMGRVDEAGRVLRGEWSNDVLGRVDEAGRVLRGEWSNDVLGRLEGSREAFHSGAAAFLLLLHADLESPEGADNGHPGSPSPDPPTQRDPAPALLASAATAGAAAAMSYWQRRKLRRQLDQFVGTVRRSASGVPEVGIAHDIAPVIVLGYPKGVCIPALVNERRDPSRQPETIDQWIGSRRYQYPLVAVCEGTLEYLLRCRELITMAGLLVYVAPEPVLDQLGVAIVDRGRRAGDPPIPFDFLVAPIDASRINR